MGAAFAPRGMAAIGIVFAQRLEHIRALTVEESAMLARLLAHEPARRPLRRWTFAQDAQLQALTADGLTAAEIGISIGRTTAAVRTRSKRLKQQDRQGTPA